MNEKEMNEQLKLIKVEISKFKNIIETQHKVIKSQNELLEKQKKTIEEQAEEIRYLELQLDLANDELRYGDGL